MSVGVNDIGLRDVILGCADLDFSATDLLFPATGSLAGWADELLTTGTFTALFDLLPLGRVPIPLRRGQAWLFG